MNRLINKVAVVTGAGAGIGRAIATLFHQEGCCLVLADISGEEEDVASELKGSVAVHCDVASSGDIRNACSLAESTFGRLDIYMGNAGVGAPNNRIVDADEDTIDRLLTINTRSAWLGVRHAAPIMQRAGGGSIVFTSSTSGLFGYPGMSAYAASKAGVIGLTLSAARELGGDGIRVNAICPGPTDTPNRRKYLEANGRPVTPPPGSLASSLGREGRPEEIAYGALFLASDEASFVTGAILPVSGGQYS